MTQIRIKRVYEEPDATDGYYKQRFDYMNLHGDVMFNLNALLDRKSVV